MLYAAYKAGDDSLANKISKSLKKDLDQQMAYLTGLPDSKQEAMQQEVPGVQRLQMQLQQLEMQFKGPKVTPVTEGPTPTIKTAPASPAKTDSPEKKTKTGTK